MWLNHSGYDSKQRDLCDPAIGIAGIREAIRSPEQNDAADAEAICEAVTRPSMRFVPTKSASQQAALSQHRVRDLLVRQRTMLIKR